MKDGLEGEVYEMNILPNTARQLVEAIYSQPDLPVSDVFDMADHLDERYGMSDFVPTNSRRIM